jgi:hypothetical protein
MRKICNYDALLPIVDSRELSSKEPVVLSSRHWLVLARRLLTAVADVKLVARKGHLQYRTVIAPSFT